MYVCFCLFVFFSKVFCSFFLRWMWLKATDFPNHLHIHLANCCAGKIFLYIYIYKYFFFSFLFIYQTTTIHLIHNNKQLQLEIKKNIKKVFPFPSHHIVAIIKMPCGRFNALCNQSTWHKTCILNCSTKNSNQPIQVNNIKIIISEKQKKILKKDTRNKMKNVWQITTMNFIFIIFSSFNNWP